MRRDVVMKLTITTMNEAAFDAMKAARDRGFTSVLLETLDEGARRVLCALGFHVVDGKKGVFVNWDRPRPTTAKGVPANLAAHYKKAGGADATSYRDVARRARAAYKASLAS